MLQSAVLTLQMNLTDCNHSTDLNILTRHRIRFRRLPTSGKQLMPKWA